MPFHRFSNCDFVDLGEVGYGFSGLVLQSKLTQNGQMVARKIIHETMRKRADSQIILPPLTRELSIYNEIAKRGGCEFIVKCFGCIPPGEKGHVHGGLVLELMDLGSLHDLLLRHGGAPLPEPIILAVAYSLFGACHFLQTTGMLHRDIKPSNILFNRQGHIKICDFGEAACIESCQDANNPRNGGGSLAYMAPERLSGQAHGPAADIWSIGTVLLEMALGRFPFQSSENRGSCSSFSDTDCSMIELWETITDESSFPPGIDCTRYSHGLAALISACLQQNPAKRPLAGQMLASELFESRAMPLDVSAFLLFK